MDNCIAEHIIKHPEDCSLLFVKNDEQLLSVHEHTHRPLASIYKLIILLAYVAQCKKGNIHPNDQIHFNQLKRYWIHWIDPNFLKWYERLKSEKKIKKDCVALKEVVKGMLEYSCNTNTDYLLATIGVATVNEQLKKYHITNHNPVIPICTSVLVSIRDAGMSHTPVSLGTIAQESFEYMIEGKRIEGLDLNLLNDFDYEMQCRWSDLLPHASVHTYVDILKQLQALQKETKDLQDVMSWFGQLKTYKEYTGGMKLGYTPIVFNAALYMSDASGNEYQLVYFLNNLTTHQKQAIELASNDFNLKLLKNPAFVDQLIHQVTHVNIC
ncbi:serine hydrolase [uncultured Dokdonia sp.]|uniref:serine hydrolase n=1 Tax=uncultured Dokdonia sp. TaxID=575653 RepID=UPI002617FE2E|nr:serine hydrolase [uncultured Dokdonia sp.]